MPGGGAASLDRNLYLKDALLNGVDQDVAASFGVNGTKSFIFAKPVDLPTPTYAQLAEGTSAANTLGGGAGADIIRGGAGNDVMTGGAGADTFIVAAGDGADRITDFASGIDRIFFKGVDAASLKAVAATVDGIGGTQITYGTGTDSLFLAGVTALKQGDLVFG